MTDLAIIIIYLIVDNYHAARRKFHFADKNHGFSKGTIQKVKEAIEFGKLTNMFPSKPFITL